MISYKSAHVQVCLLKCLNRQVGITFIHFTLYVSPINNTNLTPQSLFFSHMFSENYRQHICSQITCLTLLVLNSR